jgi:hypothetical protein
MEKWYMWTALLLLAFPAAAAPGAMPLAPKDPPVRVWFNYDGHYAYGDRAKVYAKSAHDGNLIVLRSDDAGHVRVLFPLDPQGEQRITGGKKFELKGRGGREAFWRTTVAGTASCSPPSRSHPFDWINSPRTAFGTPEPCPTHGSGMTPSPGSSS